MIIQRIDVYILKRVSYPLMAAIGIAMGALLMERLIRLLDLLATRGGPVGIVLRMLANLVPHYLSIAIPTALFVGVLYAGMRLSADSELDAMRASGLSLARLLRPILALAIVLTILSAYVVGFLQPYTRFAYHALVYLVTETAWDSAIERGAFFSGFGDKTILIGDISEGGRKLSTIFIKESDGKGNDIVTTAREGRLDRSPDLSLTLLLSSGIRTEFDPGTDKLRSVHFSELSLPLESIAPEPFRARGRKESELDFIELLRAYFVHLPDPLDIEDVKAEINSRLSRSLSVIVLPFLAFPIGISSRRTSKSLRLLAGILSLVAYFEILQFGSELVASKMAGPLLAIWVPFLTFGAGGVWIFHLANARPGADPLAHVLEPIAAAVDRCRRFVLGFLKRRPAGIAR